MPQYLLHITHLRLPRFIAFTWLIFSLLSASSSQAQALPGPGNTLDFNGYSTSIHTETSNRGILDKVTVEAWIRTNSSSYQWILGKYSNSLVEEKGYHLITQNGTASFNGRANVGVYMSSGPSTTRIDDGRWHHVVGVCDIDVWKIYVDGVLENSRAYGYSKADLTTSSTLAIGKYFVQSENFFSGEIDEIKLWRTALTAEQIQANMCRKLTTAPAELVGYYTFDQSSGTTVIDKGSVPVNGTLQNFGNAPWKLSGAPIGDLSASIYGSNLSKAKLGLKAANGDSAIVSSLALTDGVQLYAVNQAPSIKPVGSATDTYFGVFSRGSTGTYQLRLHPEAGASSCTDLYTRSTNTNTWTEAAPVLSNESLVLAAQSYRSEYIPVSSAGDGGKVDITGGTLLCPGSALQLGVSVPGASAYKWSTGATTSTISVTQAGTYSVTVTLAGGCTITGSQTVVAPTLALEGETLLCSGSSVQLRAVTPTAGVSFKWNTGATTATLAVTKAGTYTVTATFPNGCTLTSSRTISIPTLQLTGPSLVCPGTTVQLKAQAAPTATYKWSTGATTATLPVTQAGTYTVTATFANGCTLTSSTTLSAPTVRVTGATLLCANSTTTLQATATPATGATFQWSTGATTAAIQVTKPGTYRVTTQFPSGCTVTSQHTVVQPALKLSADTLLCPNGTLQLRVQSITAGATGVRWNTGATTEALIVAQPGTYTLVATYPNGCQVEARRTVVQPKLTLSADTVLCAGRALSLTPTLTVAGATYRWSTGATTASISPAQAGTYTLTVTYPNGCTLTAKRTVIQPAVAIAGATQICAGGSVQLQATEGKGVVYKWNTGATTAAISVTKPGTYSVSATYPGGCTVTDEHTVMLFQPTLTITGDSLLCPGAAEPFRPLGRVLPPTVGAMAPPPPMFPLQPLARTPSRLPIHRVAPSASA
ncbi:LamG domain-containing protein [Hymenobacter lutimineralis]|uniref:LamG domain-containing protein n=1 Tax=Hymenobacter lutimineralis TaxID=2606448 RepID=A0A5D6V5X4_9BACT|nr:LamG domain-containing protein [Hymenobacter lutimineralis]